ncbi:MAG: cache domain-containing protein [Burkholderiaceae bacterium]
MIRSGPRWTLFQKYAAYCAGLVSVALLVSGLTGSYFAYRETRALVEEVQREKARAAAQQIEQFAQTIESQLKAAFVLRPDSGSTDLQEQHFELLRLLRQASAIVDLGWIDASGRQQLKVSRVDPDEIGRGQDLSDHPAVAATLGGKSYFSSVYFRKESEPYFSVATPGTRPDTGVMLAEVNLKFVRDLVSAIKVGTTGRAYVVDASGTLISHPDLSLVLRRTDLSNIEPVRSALVEPGRAVGAITIASAASDGTDRQVLTAEASIPALGWHVFVEQPLAEAFEPVYASVVRTGVLLAAGIALALAASLALARKMTAPIRALTESARRIGEGRLEERVTVATGDELEALGEEFNRMAQRLRESYAGLEQKIEERTIQLAAANIAKSRFLAAASHDLRQPVHALRLYVAQLHDAASDEQRHRLYAKLDASSAIVAELIETLLDISKLDAGAVTPRPAEFGIQSLLNRIENAFSAGARAKGLRLRIRPSPLRVWTDPLLLERIVMNLAANAVRYTREGGVLIGCRRRAGVARIEIWDTGVGIAPDQTKRIFEEFYQAPRHADDGVKGIGLGLAIVDRLAELLGLPIGLRSVEGRGSMFAVTIPMAAQAGTAETAQGVEPRASMRFDGALALVVDDDAESRDAVAGLLVQWGWRVIAARDGDAAVTALGVPGMPVDVIICNFGSADIALGTHVIQRVRSVCGGDVPAIIISAEATAELRDSARSAGLHLLTKPLRAAKLRTLLHYLHGQRATADHVSS